MIRSGFCFKSLAFIDISTIKIIRSSRVKRPILVFLFGLLLLAPVVYTLSSSQGYLSSLVRELDEPVSTVRSFKFFGYLLLSIGLLIALAIMSFRLVFVPVLVLKCELNDGSLEVFDLKTITDEHKTYELMQFLRAKFNENQLDFTTEIL